MTEHSDHAGDGDPGDARSAPGDAGGGVEDSFEIPVLDAGIPGDGAAAGEPALTARDAGQAPADKAGDWTRTGPVRDDPGTLGEEARKLWDAVRGQFVEPLLRNYPEAAGHLSSAGLEFASAFRALVRGSEQQWTGKPPAEPAPDAPSDWDGRIVIGEDGSETDDGAADRPTD
jgi:hypothetical protein